MDTTADTWTKTQADVINESTRILQGQKGDVDMTQDQKTGECLLVLKDNAEVTSLSSFCVEKLDSSEPVSVNKNPEKNSRQQKEFATVFKTLADENCVQSLETKPSEWKVDEQCSNAGVISSTNASSSENKTEEPSCGMEKLASCGESNVENVTSAEQSSKTSMDTCSSAKTEEPSCEVEQFVSFGNDNSLEGKLDLEKTLNEQTTVASERNVDENLEFLDPAFEIEQFASFVSSSLEGKVDLEKSSNEQTTAISQELHASKTERVGNSLSQKGLLVCLHNCRSNADDTLKNTKQYASGDIASIVKEELGYQVNSNQHSNGEIASTGSQDSFWDPDNQDSNYGTNSNVLQQESLWDLEEAQEVSEQQDDENDKMATSPEFQEMEGEDQVFTRDAGVRTSSDEGNEQLFRKNWKVRFANEENTVGFADSTGDFESASDVELENPEVKEELEDEEEEEEFETGSSGSEEEDEGQEGDAKFDQTNICEYRSAFQRVVAEMLSERRAREAAQSKLYVVEEALEKCVSVDLANLRLALMHIQLLLREQNRARDDIVRTLQDKDDLNKLLEEKVLLLEHQKHELTRDLNQEADRIHELQRTNQKLVNVLKNFGIKNYIDYI